MSSIQQRRTPSSHVSGNRRCWHAQYRLGEIARQHGNNQRAVSGYRAALEAFSSSAQLRPMARSSLASGSGASVALGRHDEALCALQELVAIDPSIPDAHGLIGTILHLRGSNDEAIRAFERVMGLTHGNSPQAARALALINVSLRHWDKATEYTTVLCA